jgi:hypothetical protein
MRHAQQVALAHRDDAVSAFVPDGADDTLREPVAPWARFWRDHIPQAEQLCLAPGDLTVVKVSCSLAVWPAPSRSQESNACFDADVPGSGSQLRTFKVPAAFAGLTATLQGYVQDMAASFWLTQTNALELTFESPRGTHAPEARARVDTTRGDRIPRMKHIPHAVLALSALGALFVAPTTTVSAQNQTIAFPAASPPALVRDQVGLTTVEIAFGRPGVKGREIFGGLIPYGEVWRTGANTATSITFDTDVRFGGEAVSAGTYALFTIPGEKEWTVILNAAPEQWGSYAYDAGSDVLRVAVDAEALSEPVETMRLGLEHIRNDSAQLAFAWETSGFRVPIEVDIVAQLVPTIEAAMSAPGEDKPYLAAAMFYYEHDVDLDKALLWIDAGLAQQPQAVWVQYRKGLIQAKMGDTEGAKESADKAIAMAGAIPGELGAEYTRLSEQLKKRLD